MDALEDSPKETRDQRGGVVRRGGTVCSRGERRTGAHGIGEGVGVEEEGDEEEEGLSWDDDEASDDEGNSQGRGEGGGGPGVGRSVTLKMLLSEGLLQPGEAAMSIDYLGHKFTGDLLPGGQIRSQESDLIFATPTAWAVHCKKIVNPDKKSGCGWASVKYRGQKLDSYKSSWFKNKKLDRNKENGGSEECEVVEKEEKKPLAPKSPRVVMKHNILGCRAVNHDANTLVESTPFSSMGKIQPFLVSMSSNSLLVMDFHCHLTTSEVVGYLGGHWDVNAHNLAITQAFPCRCRLGDHEAAPLVEADVQRAMETRRLTLVGWYHSHPFAPASPTLRDLDSQLDHQMKMKGSSDASYTPCVGVILSPYQAESLSLESSVASYWVMPPPESRPHEYGKPMLMNYTVVQDQFLSQDALNEMKRCADFYRGEPDFINFTEKFRGNITYLDKLKATLSSKFPREHSDGMLWTFVKDLVTPPVLATVTPKRETTPVAPSPIKAPPEVLTIPTVIPSVPKVEVVVKPAETLAEVKVEVSRGESEPEAVKVEEAEVEPTPPKEEPAPCAPDVADAVPEEPSSIPEEKPPDDENEVLNQVDDGPTDLSMPTPVETKCEEKADDDDGPSNSKIPRTESSEALSKSSPPPLPEMILEDISPAAETPVD
ncbi:MPN domain-containing protein-like isoform X2 [Ischnura elegans]|uniref:MPN domain-containing protein-like isoform X2 n=1 Tax=Ischnura elegans TaxID=197161 RepID=UPI001ED89B45|nr:MPN domain-containing protein-like isoform X2 [Ischnura elegans]